MNINRRGFLASTAALCTTGALASERAAMPIVDTHMHVWANDATKYAFPHPYVKDFTLPPHEATLEMLIDDMDRHGCTHAVLVQVIYHGWDNSYVADCLKRYPD